MRQNSREQIPSQPLVSGSRDVAALCQRSQEVPDPTLRRHRTGGNPPFPSPNSTRLCLSRTPSIAAAPVALLLPSPRSAPLQRLPPEQ